ncbi:MAG: tRNA 2-thiouridine(34) synthase MnmA [Acidobacteriota bacterium]
MGEKVLVALSGGVDSSVAALCLVEEGYAVEGVTLRLYDSCGRPSKQACCGLEDAADAREVCRRLGIPHRLLEHQEAFRRLVIEPFAAAYAAGRTPNPCILCNERVKFGTLFTYARERGFAYVATGHHARLVPGQGPPALCRGRDRAKDQSYVLFPLDGECRRRTFFPVGDLLKEEVRERARRAGLPTAGKRESQDVCFVGGEGYARFVEGVLGEASPAPGVVRHVDGRTLGGHRGIHHFTVGQRRGLGIPAAEPLYVVSLNPRGAEVVVGPRGALGVRRFRVEGWVAHEEPPDDEGEAWVQVRYRQAPRRARLTRRGSAVVVEWAAGPAPVTPGQAAVAYRGDRVIGGGWIAGSEP